MEKISTIRRCFQGRKDGFTVIEIISVLIILGILSAVVVPRFFSAESSFSLARGAAVVSRDILNAQELAVTSYDSKKVVFVQNDNFYQVRTGDDSLLKTVNLPERVLVTSSDVTFTFNSLGEPVTGGGGFVTIGTDDGETRTINVSNYTGKVTIS